MKFFSVSIAVFLTISIASAQEVSPARRASAAETNGAVGASKTCLYRDKPLEPSKHSEAAYVVKIPANAPCPESAPLDRAAKISTKVPAARKNTPRAQLKTGALVGEQAGEKTKSCLYTVNGALRPTFVDAAKTCPARMEFR